MPDEPTGSQSDPQRTRPIDPVTATTRPGQYSSPAPIPTHIGRYQILRVLGEGGMGTVYEAQQEHPSRTVAFKVIRAGALSAQSLRRFEHESQVLGRLQHPGIAQVYEAGTVADGAQDVPFFAMEFIRGTALTQYANDKKLGARERLDMIARVCDAVYHAHQKGVIHRDLKPANILVDERGQPKILDFGVARATDSDIKQTTVQTDIGQIIGTVPYMSPEQVGGDPGELDTRSDVYALGVVAYELLAGRLPYDISRRPIHEAARIIREEDPSRLSSIDRALRGDVETIVAKALEKDKTRRYQSADSLAADIRRYLRDEPIAARPASTWYQAAKFSRRHKGLVAGIAAAFLMLVLGLVGTRWQAVAAIHAKDAAEAQRDKAEKIAAFMEQMLTGVGPSVARGRDTVIVKEMMDTAAAQIAHGELKAAPEAEIRLRRTIGGLYSEIAEYQSAAGMLEPALDLAVATYGNDHAEVVASLTALGWLAHSKNDPGGAERHFARALEIQERTLAGDHPGITETLEGLARARADLGRPTDAEPLYRRALEMNQRLFSGDHRYVARSLYGLGFVLRSMNRPAEAEPYLVRALEMNRRLFEGDTPNVANTLSELAMAFDYLGRPAEAEPLLVEAMEMSRRLYKRDHHSTATILCNLASTRQALGRLSEAESLAVESLEMRRRLFGEDHIDVAESLNALALIRHGLGRTPEAEPLFAEALEINRRMFKGDHPRAAAALSNLGAVLQFLDRTQDAQPFLSQSLEMYRRISPPDSSDVLVHVIQLAKIFESLGRPAEAEPLYREALNLQRARLPSGHAELIAAASSLGSVLADLAWEERDVAGAEQPRARAHEAQTLCSDVLSLAESTMAESDWRLAQLRSLLGGSLVAVAACETTLPPQGRVGMLQEAEPMLIAAFDSLQSAGAQSAGLQERARRAANRLVRLYTLWDQLEPGTGKAQRAGEWRAKAGPSDIPNTQKPAAVRIEQHRPPSDFNGYATARVGWCRPATTLAGSGPITTGMRES